MLCAQQDIEIQNKHRLEPACSSSFVKCGEKDWGGINKVHCGSSFPVAVHWLQPPLARTCVEEVQRRAALCTASPTHQPKHTSLAAELTVSTVHSQFPEVWLFSHAEERCSQSVLPCLVLSIPQGEGTRTGGCCTAEKGHKCRSVKSPAGGWWL